MKRVLFSALLGMSFLFTSQVSAQKLNIGINGAGALPLGDLADGTSLGFGGDVSLDYYFNDNFDLGIEVGYMAFPYDDLDGSLSMIPISLTAGIHQDIDDWIDLYGELGAGAYITKSEMEVPFFGTLETSGTYLGFSPRVGLAFELTDVLFLDVNVNYNYVLTDADFDYNVNYLGLNLGLLYTLGEY